MSLFNNAYVQGVNPRTLDLFTDQKKVIEVGSRVKHPCYLPGVVTTLSFIGERPFVWVTVTNDITGKVAVHYWNVAELEVIA